MPRKFQFTSDDEFVKECLDADDIDDVETWQNEALDYEFEFHEQHDAGFPVYMRERGHRYQLSKANLQREASKYDYLVIENNVYDRDCLNDFTAVVTSSDAALRKMAKAYYDGVEKVVAASTVRYVRFTCKKRRGWGGEEHVRMPKAAEAAPGDYWDAREDTAQKPKCPMHKNSTCMVGSVVNLPREKGVLVELEYDANLQLT